MHQGRALGIRARMGEDTRQPRGCGLLSRSAALGAYVQGPVGFAHSSKRRGIEKATLTVEFRASSFLGGEATIVHLV